MSPLIAVSAALVAALAALALFSPPPPPAESTIRIPSAVYQQLVQIAEGRQSADGRKANVSELVAELATAAR